MKRVQVGADVGEFWHALSACMLSGLMRNHHQAGRDELRPHIEAEQLVRRPERNVGVAVNQTERPGENHEDHGRGESVVGEFVTVVIGPKRSEEEKHVSTRRIEMPPLLCRQGAYT